jgi:hypothetical protein
MKHLAAYLLLGLAGNESPSAKDIKAVLDSVGIEADDERLETLLKELKGKSINEVRPDAEYFDIIGPKLICRHSSSPRVPQSLPASHLVDPVEELLLVELVPPLVVLLSQRRRKRRRRRRKSQTTTWDSVSSIKRITACECIVKASWRNHC